MIAFLGSRHFLYGINFVRFDTSPKRVLNYRTGTTAEIQAHARTDTPNIKLRSGHSFGRPSDIDGPKPGPLQCPHSLLRTAR